MEQGGDAAKAPTRADVARLAGVSTAVVSFVVTGSKRVSPETEARVRAAVAELGYRPNRTARALRSGSTELFGLVVPDLVNPFFAELAVEFEGEAVRHGFATAIGNSRLDPAVEARLAAEFVNRGVDGLAIASLRQTAGSVLIPAGAPSVVWVDAFTPASGHRSIGPDAREGARELTRHLRERHGRRRVGLVLGATADGREDARERGWLEGLAGADGELFVTSWDRAGGRRAGYALLDRAPAERPDAIVAGSDRIAVGLLRAAAELRIRVPDRLAVVSFDGTEESEYTAPPLTAWRQPVAAMARAAVDALRAPGAPVHTEFRGRLLVRESCGCAAGPRHPSLTEEGPS